MKLIDFIEKEKDYIILESFLNELYNTIKNQKIFSEEHEKEVEKDLLKKASDGLNLDIKIASSFGFGIGALIQPISVLLEKNKLSFTETEVLMLSLAVLFSISRKDLSIFNKIKLKKSVVSLIKAATQFMISLVKIAGIGVDRLAEFVAFTFISIPFSNIIKKIVSHELNHEDFTKLIIGLTSSLGIHFSRAKIKALIEKIKNK